MRRDPTEFRERFKRWKAGERVYDSGQTLPVYDDGKTPEETYYGKHLPDVTIEAPMTATQRGKYYEQLAEQERARQRNIASTYFSEAPTLGNLYNGIEAFIKSLPVVGVTATDVDPNVITGVAPQVGMKNPESLLKQTDQIFQKFSNRRLFERFFDFAKNKKVDNIKYVDNNPVSKILDINTDKRFKFLPPSTYLDYDIDKMSVEELVNIFGPGAKNLKRRWDIAKAHNFQDKYGKIANDAKEELSHMFAIPKTDPDIALGLDRSKRLYSIPEYRQRFEKFGTLGDTFVDDALDRLSNVQLQGIDGKLHAGGLEASGVTTLTSLNPRVPTITIRNSDSSNILQQVMQHEGGHASHGMALQPTWMKMHNEAIKPVLKPRFQNAETPNKIAEYQDRLDEIITRSKTTVEYADRVRQPGESLNDALGRVYELAQKNSPDVPMDTKDLVYYFDKNGLLNFWKNFVGGYTIPVGIGLGIGYGASQAYGSDKPSKTIKQL